MPYKKTCKLRINNYAASNKINKIENEVTSLEENENLSEQHGRRNELEITRIPDN